ncbi:MAG: hypothetical protein RLZZ461_1306, partial [Planctomycetota bacterium]
DAGGRGGRGWSRRRRLLDDWHRRLAEAEDADPIAETFDMVASDTATTTAVGVDAAESAVTSDHANADVDANEHEPAAASVTSSPMPSPARFPLGWRRAEVDDPTCSDQDEIDRWLGGGLVVSAIHELVGDADRWATIDPRRASDRDASSAGRSGSDWIPCLGSACALLQRRWADHVARGRGAFRAVWIVGDRGRPMWSALHGISRSTGAGAGVSVVDAGLVARMLHVQAPRDPAIRRWCAEQAVRTAAIDAVVVDGRDFSLLDTRRLQIAMAARIEADHPPITIILLRPHAERRCRTAATTRWLVEPDPDARPFDGTPSWRWRLDRVRMPQTAAIGGRGDPTGLVIRAVLTPAITSSDASPRSGSSSLSLESRIHRQVPEQASCIHERTTERVRVAGAGIDVDGDVVGGDRVGGASPPDRRDRSADVAVGSGAASSPTPTRSESRAGDRVRRKRGRRAGLRGAAWSSDREGLLFSGS